MIDIFSRYNLSLRQLHQFRVLAEELHFGRAAERLNMTQPPLSMAIRALEETLALRLFERSNRHVALTCAGRTFLAEVERIEANLEQAITRTHRVAAGEEGEVRLGVLSASSFLPGLIQTVAAARPGLSLKIAEGTTAEQLRMISEDRIDAGLMRPPILRPDDLEHHVIAHQRLVAVLPEGHPLASLSQVPVSAFEQQPFIGTPTNAENGLHGRILSLTETAGFEPNLVQIVRETATVVVLVAGGLGISILPESAPLASYPGISVRPLEPLSNGPAAEIPLWLAWSKKNHREPFRGLLEIIR
ncbi:LysR substrate-binding domain-containing protein [Nisaea sp.]|uniref:LysR substrate-binding domain-containing protein n=1 Tax=Nisaea sp. TaxID=2024842 RepID=UPI003297D904